MWAYSITRHIPFDDDDDNDDDLKRRRQFKGIFRIVLTFNCNTNCLTNYIRVDAAATKPFTKYFNDDNEYILYAQQRQSWQLSCVERERGGRAREGMSVRKNLRQKVSKHLSHVSLHTPTIFNATKFQKPITSPISDLHFPLFSKMFTLSSRT